MSQKASEEELLLQQRVNVLALQRAVIFNEQGEEVLFSTLWKDQKVVVIFIRHFGCVSCRAHVYTIQKACREKYKNLKVIYIGSGQSFLIHEFKKDLNIPDAEIYTDPSLETFQACGMHSGIFRLMNLKTLKAVRELYKQGHSDAEMKKENGSKKQLGGVVVFTDPGKVLYHFASEYLGDFDDPDGWP
jgi:peroxiredoxin